MSCCCEAAAADAFSSKATRVLGSSTHAACALVDKAQHGDRPVRAGVYCAKSSSKGAAKAEKTLWKNVVCSRTLVQLHADSPELSWKLNA